MNVVPRKGRVSVLGPCSRIVGFGVKNLSRVAWGGSPAAKALQKPSAVLRMVFARFARSKGWSVMAARDISMEEEKKRKGNLAIYCKER